MNNRAASRNRKKFDQYFTPEWATLALLDHEEIPKSALIGEPCAGAGHIVKALNDRGHTVKASEIDFSVEPIADGLGIEYEVDFLGDYSKSLYGGILHQGGSGVDWIITNPPYYCKSGTAAQIFKRATEIAPNVAMLMRLGWLEACQDRADLLPTLSRAIIIPRVQFIGAGGTSNSSPSVWCIWKKDHDGPTRLEWADRDRCRELQG